MSLHIYILNFTVNIFLFGWVIIKIIDVSCYYNRSVPLKCVRAFQYSTYVTIDKVDTIHDFTDFIRKLN